MARDTNSSSGQYAAATEALRSTAKWLLAGLAGVGAVLVAGLQLSDLGALSSGDLLRLLVSIAALVGATAAVADMIRHAVAILTSEWVTLADFTDQGFEARVGHPGLEEAELKAIEERIKIVGEELFTSAAPTVARLHAYLRTANERLAAIGAGTEMVTDTERAAAQARVAELRAVARDVADFANYERTRRLFDALKPRLVVGAAVVVVCVMVFAVAANPPPQDKPVQVQLVPTTSTTPPTTAPITATVPSSTTSARPSTTVARPSPTLRTTTTLRDGSPTTR